MTQQYRQHVYTPPPGAVEVVLIRHGESQAALPGKPFPLVGGHGDPALHPNGVAQANAVAKRLKSEPLSAIYVTTLRRTVQTAAPLAKVLHLTPMVAADLREVFLGDWDGGEYRIRAANGDPAFKRAIARQEWGEIPGAETTAALHARVLAALHKLAARHADQRIAAVVHGGVIGAIMALATGARPFAFGGVVNGSISRIVLSNGEIVVRSFNECAHLT